jgi:hypothetical protein
MSPLCGAWGERGAKIRQFWPGAQRVRNNWTDATRGAVTPGYTALIASRRWTQTDTKCATPSVAVRGAILVGEVVGFENLSHSLIFAHSVASGLRSADVRSGDISQHLLWADAVVIDHGRERMRLQRRPCFQSPPRRRLSGASAAERRRRRPA